VTPTAAALAPFYFYTYGTMNVTRATARLGALAQPTRLAAFRCLVQSGPQGLCVSELAAKLRVPMPTLSFHLKELTRAGLLVTRQRGRFTYLAPDFAAMSDLVDYLTDNCCNGAGCELAPAARGRRR
jgi:ArsR family transcriptional regulator, arsenate/arsenite/antimonite-responsive transcriptional repressor